MKTTLSDSTSGRIHRAFVVGCVLAALQTGCVTNMDMGETTPLQAAGTDTATGTHLESATQTSLSTDNQTERKATTVTNISVQTPGSSWATDATVYVTDVNTTFMATSPRPATTTKLVTATMSNTGTATGTQTVVGVVAIPVSSVATATQTYAPAEDNCDRLTLRPGVLNPCGRTISLAYSPDVQLLASNRAVWRMSDGQRVARLESSEDSNLQAVFSNDGKYLASSRFAGSGDMVQLWDGKTLAPIATLPVATGNYASALAWNLDSSLLAVGGFNSTIEIWNVARRELVKSLTAACSTDTIHFSPDDTQMIVASCDERARIWSVSDWRQLAYVLSIASEMSDANFSPSQGWIASTGSNGAVQEVRLWSAEDGSLLQVVGTHSNFISRVLWAGELLISNDWGGVVNSWRMQTDGRFHLSTSWSTAGTATGQAPQTGEYGRSIGLAVTSYNTNLVAGGYDPVTGRYGFMFLDL